jgi:hypothetical protein
MAERSCPGRGKCGAAQEEGAPECLNCPDHLGADVEIPEEAVEAVRRLELNGGLSINLTPAERDLSILQAAYPALRAAILDDLKEQLRVRMAERMTSPSVYASLDPAGYERGRGDVMQEFHSALHSLENPGA